MRLEAIKMETTVRAERNAIIKEIMIRPGLEVETGDLLIVLEEGVPDAKGTASCGTGA